MLEVKNLVKVYKTKGGADVRAIDDVSVRFGDKGMVFLLGKSGSGKSTLLNLCGGLDFPDSGEIVIKGRSSKDFSQADFDSYRNTFVGFVFQEYNILDEFSVADNVALALDLQGRSKNRSDVTEILRQVEMEGFADRKPNTLSGGQKQRIAIARALVKNPEIILADEPTGALDSATGKQILDTLNKLSEDKLVIVVSHDREFAEQYGDRIIELKDGKIISDVTKTVVEEDETDNVTLEDDDTIVVRKGASLTDEDFKKIRDFLSAPEDEGREKRIGLKKRGAGRTEFEDTHPESVQSKSYTAEDCKLIRSRLPLKHACKIGASSLKVKPFRLFFTILLSFVAFAMFGLFSTLTFYNAKSTAVSTYKKSGYDYLYTVKNYNYINRYYSYGKDDGYYSSSYRTRFTPGELSSAKQKYGSVYGAYNFAVSKYDNDYKTTIGNTKTLNSNYYSTDIRMFVEVAGNTPDFELLTATDMSALGTSDVVISSFLFDSLKEAGLYNGYKASSGYVSLENYSDIVGKTLALYCNNSANITTPVTVRGVYKADPPEKYAKIKDGTEPANSNLTANYQTLLASGMYGMVLVSPGFYDAHSTLVDEQSDKDVSAYSLKEYLYLQDVGISIIQDIGNFTYIAPLDAYPFGNEKAVFFTSGKTTLGDYEILLPFSAIGNYVTRSLEGYIDQLRQDYYDKEYSKTYSQYEETHADEISAYRKEQYGYYIECGYSPELATQYADEEVKAFVEGLISNDDPDFFRNLNANANMVANDFSNLLSSNIETIRSGICNRDGIEFSATQEEIDAAFEFLSRYCDLSGISDLSLTLSDTSGKTVLNTKIKCVGYYYGSSAISNVYAGEKLYEKISSEYSSYVPADPNGEFYSVEETAYVQPADAKYNFFVIPFPEDAALNALINDENAVAKDDSFFTLSTPLSSQLKFVNELIDSLEKIFLWVGVAMALFSMLLLFNFISVSISNKKKEIGILRAVGARSTDVFTIFYAESSIITLICFALAMIACFAICPILNSQIAAALGASIFVFGPVSWLVMLGIAVLTSVVATFLPVYAIAKKRPVESIRAL